MTQLVSTPARELAGIRIPDSKAAREATDLARSCSPPYMFNHVIRTFVFGSQLANKAKHSYDVELMYVASVLHDLGLVESNMSTGARFEIDGANAARGFAIKQGYSPEQAQTIWTAIALHTSAGIASEMPEIALVHLGAGVDVGGIGFDQLTARQINEILEAYPRLGFKKAFAEVLLKIAHKKPTTATWNFTADFLTRSSPEIQLPNFCDIIAAAPFQD
jgi:HD superfamily phosphodiesterase